MVAYDENGFLGGLIQEWIETHRKSYGPVFVLAQELNRECHRFLDGRRVDPKSKLQVTTSVLFARMVELYQAIVVVIDRGMVTPGRIIFRVFLEAFFHFFAIHRDSEYLNEYLNQFHVQRKTMVNRIRNSTSPHLEELRRPIDINLVAEIRQTLDEKGVRKVSIEEVARKADLHDIYVTVYEVLSRAVHSSASDLESHLDYNTEKETIQGFRYGPSSEETARVVCLAGLAMAEALEQMFSNFGEDRRELCSKLKSSFQGLLREQTDHGAV
jgi:hypothetical protein